jgi:hypothetical protein
MPNNHGKPGKAKNHSHYGGNLVIFGAHDAKLVIQRRPDR